MSRFPGAERWKSGGVVRTNTGSSIRGTISAPIIPVDDEVPTREPGTGLGAPLEMESAEGRFPVRPSAGSGQILQTNRIGSNAIDKILRASLPPSQIAQDPSPPQMNQSIVPSTSMTRTPLKPGGGKPQRKKSSLGTVFRKLFGGQQRKARMSLDTTGQGHDGYRAGQHRSVSPDSDVRLDNIDGVQDPTALNRSPTDTSPPQTRSVSLPINEFNRALRSHSIVVEDFPMDLEGDVSRESIQARGQSGFGATTPSRLWKLSKRQGYGDWAGLSPRPASTHGRESKYLRDAEADAAVDIAVTSGSSLPNRRSRSAGELQGDVTTETPLRRRSDEIRYWRESYDPRLLSPMSSNKADADDPIQMDMPEMPPDTVPYEQTQPFAFGPMGEMAGMKITMAASLETRVQRLEERLLQKGKAVSQRHRITSREPVSFQDPPKKNSKRERSISTHRPRTSNSERKRLTQQLYIVAQPTGDSGHHRSQKRPTSYESNRPFAPSMQISSQPFPDHISHTPVLDSGEQSPFETSQQEKRERSTSTTVQGMPPTPPTMSKDVFLTGEHYNVLMNMILAEQAARRNLQAMVQDLEYQLQDLRPLSPGRFPIASSGVHADTLRAGDGNEFSAFEQDDDSSDDEGGYIRDDIQTPSEERANFSEDIFGDVTDEDVKSSPRTLSLSRLTLGVPSSVGF